MSGNRLVNNVPICGISVFATVVIPFKMFGAKFIIVLLTFLTKVEIDFDNCSGLPLPFKKLSNAAFIELIEPWIVVVASRDVVPVTSNSS